MTKCSEPDESTPLINYHLLRLIVGAIGLSLGLLVNWKAGWGLQSISHSYHEPKTHDFFVGSLCFIGAFLCVYRGGDRWFEPILCKLAGISAVVVAFVPTAPIAPVHFSAAAIVFLVLTYLCFFCFRKNALEKKTGVANARAFIYAVCGYVMLGCILLITTHKLADFPLPKKTVFWGETIALIAFGVAWVVASKALIASSDERKSALRNP